MKKLFVTNEIPKGATILLVDLEESYFDEVIECETEEIQEVLSNRVADRLDLMKSTLAQLKKSGHTILAINANDIYEGFEGIPDEYLPQWDSEGMETGDHTDVGAAHTLNPIITERIKRESSVIVCGLWKELCVYIMARKLQESYGRNVLLYKGSDLTLDNAMMWLDDDVVTLEGVCERDSVIIEEVNQETSLL